MLLRADSAGAWSTALPLDLPDGTYTLKARARRDGEPAGQEVSVPLNWPTPTLASMRSVFPAGEASGLGIDFLTGAALKKDAGLYFGPLSGLPGLSFSRASAAMRINAAGAYESVPAHTLRTDYDPVTLAPRGYLSEPAATNLCVNNTMVGASAGTPGTLPSTGWTALGVISGLTVGVTGVGSEGGVRYIEYSIAGTPTSSGTGAGFFFCNGTGSVLSAGQQITASAFVSLVGGSLANAVLGLSVRSFAGGATTQGFQPITPTTGALTQRRFSITHTVGPSNTAADAIFYVNVTAGQPVNLTIRFGLPQVEVGTVPTSPIQTSGSTATRALDYLTLNPATYPFNWNAGAVVLEVQRSASIVAGASPVMISGGAGRILRADHMGDNSLRVYGSDNVRGVAADSTNKATAGSVLRGVIAWDSDRFYVCLNGGSIASVARANFTAFGIVQFANSYNGHLRKTAFLTRTPTAAEMQALTS